MIGSLTGRLVEKGPAEILVEAGGVGYRITVPLTTSGRLPSTGATVTLSIHTHVREDSLALFGFDSRAERDLFERLIAVPGVGPRTALSLLSHVDPAELSGAVRGRDVETLVRVPGIGRKTAERLVVELAGILDRIPGPATAAGVAGVDGGRRADLLSALGNLGYRQAQALSVVEEVLSAAEGEATLEELLRRALRRLAGPPREAGRTETPRPAAAPEDGRSRRRVSRTGAS